MHCEILTKLEELDEQTIGLDPEHPEDLDELHRISAEMERLEDHLAEISHMEWLETTWG
ncbi:MAG: hypothetical protein VW443_04850 [Pseudomonadales bacterium]|jgi:predicted  nucleic acid-binding Zn-ribbon protein